MSAIVRSARSLHIQCLLAGAIARHQVATIALG
jgi:hypothetical protein